MGVEKLMKAMSSHNFKKEHANLNWSGSFADYLGIVLERPAVARTAFQRLYAMIASFGFVVVWVCYLGVNFLGKGLHTYGQIL